ncbi:D-alanyl-D-alanine carboxypeptidase/D-alanyl-D-alanine endopeptidase [Vibrio gallicus]|uniref:D-alanyl-D-alanine carboxypeptidase/D-alanyl-D-alanine endopeptidase n=1 Tax=Vibrio gallicus TaxID=190897 RepID=UPI0021C40177|nr:D-alanyl-D-alanine carboxypeptidase/D-alanyl-D-alanine-endopeptidase [Vibrio gallicus]
MRRLFILAVGIFSYQTAMASIAPYSQLPQGSSVGIIVRDNNSELESHNPNQLMPPASTLKLVTALASKLYWPRGDFRFDTQLLKQQQNYVVRFTGDPSLLRSDLKTLLSPLKGKIINGDLLLDDSIFDGYTRGVGWPWDVLGVCYAAPVSAISIEGNCVQASITTNANGSTRVYVPSFQPIGVQSSVVSVTKQQQQQSFCDLELNTFPDNHYRLSGCLQPRSKPLPLKFALQSSELYVAAVIKQIFTDWGTTITGHIQRGKTNQHAKLITQHHSASIDELLQIMLRDSNNLYADSITKRLGHEVFGVSGSFASGTAALKKLLHDKANIDLSLAVLNDGSGLSRNNRIQPKTMMQILQYLQTHDHQLGILSMLPVAGETGTLKHRPSMRKDPIKGHILAKSGSLFGTHNIVGYTLDDKGNIKGSFVEYVSNYHPKKGSDIPPAITVFEQNFYRNLLNK